METHAHHRTRTLWLSGILHALTHVYHVALLPLYLLIQKDFKLQEVDQATLLVTVMMMSYFVPSYAMGILADRLSRKKLLAAGLAINGLGFVGLSCAPNYASALVCVMLAGFGGSFYHPAATAMVARLFPVGTGKALGLVGIGAGVGFFISPIYAGWRVEALEPVLGAAAWRRPILEMGLLGVIVAGIFYWLAQEEPPQIASLEKTTAPQEKLFPTTALFLFFASASFFFGLRDFSGSAMGSLGSLYLQKAQLFDPKHTGLTLSGIFLASSISNPLFGKLSDGGRIRWTTFVLSVAAILIFIFPRVPAHWVAPTLFFYGFFFMASYPVIEAALMESVHDSVRGRVFGFFITVGGLVGNLSHWLAGKWVRHLGGQAGSSESYYPIYNLLALLVVISLAGLPCLHAIRKREFDASGHEIDPATKAVPQTPG